RGAIVGATVNGLLISWLPLFILPLLGSLKLAASTFADTDYLIPGIVLGNVGKTGAIGVTVGILLFVVVVLIASKFIKAPAQQK
ncbi:PTS transporter subunit IIC, partial [Limosilactobacillus fermentum]